MLVPEPKKDKYNTNNNTRAAKYCFIFLFAVMIAPVDGDIKDVVAFIEFPLGSLTR